MILGSNPSSAICHSEGKDFRLLHEVVLTVLRSIFLSFSFVFLQLYLKPNKAYLQAIKKPFINFAVY